MASRIQPSLAGKPPFATDEPDSAFEERVRQPRLRQKPAPVPNDRSSAYDVYDNYLEDDSNRNSGIGALGMGFMNADMDDSDDDIDDEVSIPVPKPAPAPVPAAQAQDQSQVPAQAPSSNPASAARRTPPLPVQAVASHPQPPAVIPLASPRPGYAAPVSALKLTPPQPIAVPAGRQPGPPGLRIQVSPTNMHFPPPGSPASVPSTPHPLQAPMTPITPAFARPPKSPAIDEKVKFDLHEPIMRSNSEDLLIPKRGEKGDDFWRRFSMIAKEENQKPPKQKESTWLRKTQSGSTRLSRWVWFTAIILLLLIGGAIGLRLYLTHNSNPNSRPSTLGGSAGELNSSAPISSSTSTIEPSPSSSSSLHVSPTNTVARREPVPTLTTGLLTRHQRMRSAVNRSVLH